MDKEKRIHELIDALNSASERYYNGLEESISNYEWDAMFDELTKLEEETGLIFPDSPTQKAGYEETSGEKEAHEYPALSLAKTKSIEELKAFAGERDIFLSYKLDGLTLVLTYETKTEEPKKEENKAEEPKEKEPKKEEEKKEEPKKE